MKRKLLIGICGAACVLLLANYWPRPLARGEAKVSYELTKADGSVHKSQRLLIEQGRSAEDSFAKFRSELAGEKGSLVFHTDAGPDAAVEMQGMFANGDFEGNVRTFTILKETRTLISEESFHQGRREGRSVSYFPDDGTLLHEGQWKHGVKDGQWTFNARRFKPALIVTFRDGMLHGETRIYDQSGRTIIKGEYRDGNPHEGTFVDNPFAVIDPSLRLHGQIPVTRRHFHDGVETQSEAVTLTPAK